MYYFNCFIISKELVYQEIFHRFGDFDKIRLSTPLSIYTLILIALDSPLAGWVESNGDKETIAKVLQLIQLNWFILLILIVFFSRN